MKPKRKARHGQEHTVEYLKFSDGRTEEDLPRPKLDLCSKNSPEPQYVTIICDMEEAVQVRPRLQFWVLLLELIRVLL